MTQYSVKEFEPIKNAVLANEKEAAHMSKHSDTAAMSSCGSSSKEKEDVAQEASIKKASRMFVGGHEAITANAA